MARRDPGESLVPDITSLQSPVPAVTRPTHFNFYLSGALVTYNDITPDLPQAELDDLSLCCPLIGHLTLSLSSDWLVGAWCRPWAPCHRVMVSSGPRVTNINCNVRTLFQTDLHCQDGHYTWGLRANLSPFAHDDSPVVRRCSQARRHPAACHSQMYHR